MANRAFRRAAKKYKPWVAKPAGIAGAAVAASFLLQWPASAEPALVSAMALSPSRGYWLVTRNGAVYSYGGAHYYGGANRLHLHLTGPIVGIVSTPDGKGLSLIHI